MNKQLPTTLKITTRIRYPKQICFTSNFLKQLEREYKAIQQHSDVEQESSKPVAKYKEKFIKAINFYLSQL